ncbi:MAG: hypothetical protein EPO55_23150 [Reyranella sp.]|uniref:hypothetical protein n=1 Tax=Reyranella sp. TaxID=1929291 RepID=UPI001209C9BB|nr:hypothetical protein [Reyranella sp.]TAJ36090.1 MAG: hypothetical protein EPO55_23150 [Reyranella sp.]
MSFRRAVMGVVALASAVAGCSPAPLPQATSPDPADPQAPAAATPYKPVLAGTAAFTPVGLKPWRELNDSVAPGAGRSP